MLRVSTLTGVLVVDRDHFDWWKNVHGFDMSPMIEKAKLATISQPKITTIRPEQCLARAEEIRHLDLKFVTEEEIVSITGQWVGMLQISGWAVLQVHGWACYRSVGGQCYRSVGGQCYRLVGEQCYRSWVGREIGQWVGSVTHLGGQCYRSVGEQCYRSVGG